MDILRQTMNTKIVIENGNTSILLTPENDFEKDIIEKIEARKKDYTINAYVNAQLTYSTYSKHQIEITLEQKI